MQGTAAALSHFTIRPIDHILTGIPSLPTAVNTVCTYKYNSYQYVTFETSARSKVYLHSTLGKKKEL